MCDTAGVNFKLEPGRFLSITTERPDISVNIYALSEILFSFLKAVNYSERFQRFCAFAVDLWHNNLAKTRFCHVLIRKYF